MIFPFALVISTWLLTRIINLYMYFRAFQRFAVNVIKTPGIIGWNENQKLKSVLKLLKMRTAAPDADHSVSTSGWQRRFFKWKSSWLTWIILSGESWKRWFLRVKWNIMQAGRWKLFTFRNSTSFVNRFSTLNRKFKHCTVENYVETVKNCRDNASVENNE